MAALTATLCILLVIAQTCYAAQLTISPPSLTLSGNSSVGTVRFSCVAGAGIAQNDLIALTISRVATGGLGQPIQMGSASTRNNNGVAKMDTVITGATIEGSIAQQFITITMTETTCGADEAKYICASTSYPPTGSIIINAEDRKNFTVDVPAGFVSMTQEPLIPSYVVNDALIMRCNGLVGSNLPSVKIDWVWQYKDRIGFSYNDYPRSEDILTEGIFQDTNNRCQYRQASTLARQITLEDYGREYRCFVRRNNAPSEPDSQHSDSYTIRAVYEDSGPRNPTSTLSPLQRMLNSRYDEGYSSGWTVGAGLGFRVMATVLAVVAVVVVTLLVWSWRRQWKLPCAETSTAKEKLVPTAPPLQQGETTLHNPVNVAGDKGDALNATGPYSELRQHEVGLQSPYAELNPYIKPSYRDAISNH